MSLFSILMMQNSEIRLLRPEELPRILPLACELNPSIPSESILSRLKEIEEYPNYKCVATFSSDLITGICGFWITTRFYCGKQLEVDNLIVAESHRSLGIGQRLMDFIVQFGLENECESIELNTYVTNFRSHKFYLNDGYSIIGYHMQKMLNTPPSQ